MKKTLLLAVVLMSLGVCLTGCPDTSNLTVMQNPLMSGVWAGALVLVLSGFVLVVPVRRRKSA